MATSTNSEQSMSTSVGSAALPQAPTAHRPVEEIGLAEIAGEHPA